VSVSAPATTPPADASPTDWAAARAACHEAGRALAVAPRAVALREADGSTLAEPLVARVDLPAFPTSSVDGYAARGRAPWRITGRVLAGAVAGPLTEDGTCVEIATGAMVPEHTDVIVRVEHSTQVDGRVTGVPRPEREWRVPGEECARGEELLPAGAPVTPGVLGLAAACGYDTLSVRPAPNAALLVFGDELLGSGLPGDGRVRDSLGPQIPAWLQRLGARCSVAYGPVADTLDAHVHALRDALASGADLICTTGGTMNGPVDHLHPTLERLGASYVVNTVAVRPGFPMLLARCPRPDGGHALVAGLPGNPQSAIVALASLVAPALDGLRGRPAPRLPRVRLAGAVPGRGGFTHLALVALDATGAAVPVRHVGSAMLRGLAQAAGFAVIPPGDGVPAGHEVDLLALPGVA
jgi:molybdopterin molybdotransferase